MSEIEHRCAVCGELIDSFLPDTSDFSFIDEVHYGVCDSCVADNSEQECEEECGEYLILLCAICGANNKYFPCLVGSCVF